MLKRAARCAWRTAQLVVLVVLARGVAADDAPTPSMLPGATDLPANATTYIYRMGWSSLRPKLAGTTAEKLFNDPDSQAFFAEVQRLADRKDQMAPLLRFALLAMQEDLLLSARPLDASHPPTTAPAAAEDDGDPDERERPAGERTASRLAIVKPVAENRAALRAAHAATIENWPREMNTADVDGAEFQVLGDEDDGVYTAWRDDVCYWGLGRESAAHVLAPPPGEKLATAPLFQSSLEPLLSGMTTAPFVVYYHDLRPMWARLDGATTPDQAGWKNVSWHSLDAVAGAAFVEGGGFRVRHYWRIGPQRSGLFLHSRESRIDPEWLKRIPADATSFTTGVFDGQSLAVSAAALFAMIFGDDDEALVAMAPEWVKPFEPVAATLGNRYLIYRVPTRYGSFPIANVIPLANAVVALERKPGTDFLKAFDALLAVSDIPGDLLDRTTIAGSDVRVVNLLYLALFIAVREDVVLVTGNPQLLRDAVEGWAQPGPSLVESETWRKAAAALPSDACFVMYFAPGGFCRGVMDEWLPSVSQMAALMRFFADFSLFVEPDEKPKAQSPGLNGLTLPRGRALARHINEPTILWARDDGAGVLFDGHSAALCTPYYWAYVYALTHMHEYGAEGVFSALSYLLSPSAEN